MSEQGVLMHTFSHWSRSTWRVAMMLRLKPDRHHVAYLNHGSEVYTHILQSYICTAFKSLTLDLKDIQVAPFSALNP